MDRAHGRIFIGCRSGVMTVLDSETGRIVTTQPIGKGVDATEFDSSRALIYFSCGDGTLSVFHEDAPDKYTLVESIKTQSGARTLAVDQKSGKAYLSVAESGPRPPAIAGTPQARAPMLPGSFGVIVIGK